MNVYDNVSLTIGNTPLVRLNRIEGGKYPNNLFVKIEGQNPAYSVKCRVATGIINRAVETGELKKGMCIVEATSGNTGGDRACLCRSCTRFQGCYHYARQHEYRKASDDAGFRS